MPNLCEAPPSNPAHAEPPLLTLLELTLVFARIGSLAWGGGGATLAMMHDEFCTRRPVLPEEEFGTLFALSRVLPGMNLLSLTVLLGYRSHGIFGALAALLGLTVPSFALIVLGCLLLRGGHPSPYLLGAIRGLAPAAAALLLYAGWQMCQGSLAGLSPLSRLLWITVLLVTAALTAATPIHPAWPVVCGGAFGVLAARRLAGPEA